TLRDTHLYQAMNYAATQGIRWCVLTNGTDWQVYRIDWSQSGVSKELLLDIRLLEENLDVIVDKLQYLAKKSLARDEIEEYWIKHQALSVSQVLTALFSERVFDALRKELKGLTDYNPSYEELARSLKQALSEEALELAADLKLPKKAKPKAERKAVEPEEEGGKEESGEEPKIISRIQEETQE
ncbi:MAG: hypothetical protein HY347_04300, partial [candidate division NC10 bacterium]|nr:hypothetical protein [candidate division NC10 bacterium]